MKNLKQFLTLAVLVILIAGAVIAFASPAGVASFFDDLIHEAGYAIDAGTDLKSEPTATASATAVSSFHFLPPLTTASGDPSKFDPTLLNAINVEVCEVLGSNCTLVKTFNSQTATSEQLRILSNSREGSYYIANWDVTRVNLGNKTFRITVTMAQLLLGSVDLPPNVYSKFGRTWPIKFLIEKDPVLRVRYLRSLGRSASQVVSALRSEFGICGSQAATLLASDLEPFAQSEIDVAIQGACQNVIVPDTTKITDEATRNSLIAYDPVAGTMIFAFDTPVISNLKAGDVFVSEPGPAAPFGFLRKVTSKRKVKSQTVLETVQAKLNEAISQGTLIATGDLLPANVAASSSGLAYENSLLKGSEASLNALDVGDGFNFHRDVDITFNFDGSGGGASGSGNVHVTGAIDFNASYDLGMGIETCAEIPPVCVDRVEAHVDVNQKSNIRVTGQFDGTLHKEQTIDTIQFSPITFFIGPIPVVIVPTIDVIVGVDGEAHANFVFAANASSVLKLGAKWTDRDDGGNGWEDIKQFSPLQGGVTESDLKANLKVEGYGKANAKLLLYDVAGPGMAGSIGLGAEVRLGQKPLWTIYGHIVGDVNFSVDIAAIIDLGNYSHRVLDESFKIGEAANQAPVFSNVNTDVIQANVNSPVVLGPRFGGLSGYFDCMDPEGGQLTYSASSDVDGPLANLSPSFQTAGLRTITIRASDSENASASIILRVDIRNSLPIVSIHPSPPYSVPKTVQFFLTADAYDPESGNQNPANGFLTCDRINWNVSAPDMLTRTGSGGTCGATIIFNQEGQRTVTVSATDPNGGIGTASITVAVTPEPLNHPPVVNFFEVYAYRGPFSITCPDTNYYCQAPDNRVLYNGLAGSGDYYPPLLLDIVVSDPDNDPVTVQWHCRTGQSEAPIVWNQEYQFWSCDPLYSAFFPIEVFAVVSDGINPPPPAPQRTYHMAQRVN